MRPRRLRLHVVGIAVMVAGNFMSIFTDRLWFVLWGAGAGIILFNVLRARREDHGRDRGTPSHPRNTGTFTTGGALTWGTNTVTFAPNAGTGAGLIVDNYHGLTLPVSDNKDPILAARYIDLGWDMKKDEVAFRGVAMKGHLFGVDATAMCDLGATSLYRHRAPGLGCKCGFYAVPADTLKRHAAYGAPLKAEVELFGRVIEHESGYRAERQRILSVEHASSPSCYLCRRPPNRPEDVVTVWAANERDRLLSSVLSTPRVSLLAWAHEDCLAHASIQVWEGGGPTPAKTLTLPELEERLGTPVKFGS